MKEIYLILIFFLIAVGCSTQTLPSSFSALTDMGHTQKVTLEALDLSARNYIAKEWGKPLSDIKKWKLVNAQYRDDYDAISLTFRRKITAPLVVVLFDKHGFPNKIMGH